MNWKWNTFRVVKENPQLEIGTIFTSIANPIPNVYVWIESILVGGYKHDVVNFSHILLDEVEEITNEDLQGDIEKPTSVQR